MSLATIAHFRTNPYGPPQVRVIMDTNTVFRSTAPQTAIFVDQAGLTCFRL